MLAQLQRVEAMWLSENVARGATEYNLIYDRKRGGISPVTDAEATESRAAAAHPSNAMKTGESLISSSPSNY